MVDELFIVQYLKLFFIINLKNKQNEKNNASYCIRLMRITICFLQGR